MNQLVSLGNIPAALQARMQAEMEKSKEVMTGVSNGASLPKLSIAGKEFSIRVGGQSQALRTFTLDVIIADSRAGISKQYYANAYDPSQTASSPDCASVDGITPDFTPAIIDKETGKCPYHCKNCYFNQFGTATQGKGKACKDYKRLIVLIAGTESTPFDPTRPPLTLDLPATSFHAPKDVAGVMMFREFADACERNNMPVSMVVAELSFMSGTAFSQLCMRPKRLVTEEEYNRVLEVREQDDVKDALNSKFEPRDEELPQETKEALATPADQSTPAEIAEAKAAPAVKNDAAPAAPEPKVNNEDLFTMATPVAQQDAVTPAKDEQVIEVSEKEAEAVKQLDAFFSNLQ